VKRDYHAERLGINSTLYAPGAIHRLWRKNKAGNPEDILKKKWKEAQGTIFEVDVKTITNLQNIL